MSSAREVRQAVVRSGNNAESCFNIVEKLRDQLDYTRKGIADLAKPDFLNIPDKRVANMTMVSEYGGDLERTMQEVVWYARQKLKIDDPFM